MFKNFIVFLSLFTFIGEFTLPAFAARKTSKSSGKKSTKRQASRGGSSKKSVRSVGNKRQAGRTAGRGVIATGTTSSGSAKKDCRSAYTECMDLQINNIIASYSYLADDQGVQAMQETNDPLRCIYYNSSNVDNLFGDATTSKYCSEEQMSKRNDNLINSTSGKVDLSLNKIGKETAFNNYNFCSNQKDINELYMSYNYYCDLDTSEVGVAGMPVNKCNIKQYSNGGKSKNNVFATKDSAAYYAEANRRVQAGELKIINFEQTNLFKNKISKLDLENWDMMSLTSKTCVDSDNKSCQEGSAGCTCSETNSVSDLMEDLGLASSDSELFSINVVPPVGAGSLNASGIFQKASDICFGAQVFKSAGKTLTEDEKTIKSDISILTNCGEAEVRSDLERYYLAGTAKVYCPASYEYNQKTNKCSFNGENRTIESKIAKEAEEKGIDEDKTSLYNLAPKTEITTEDELTYDQMFLVQSDFLSAKKSCDMYENTMISVRNTQYANFDTYLKNYIEDEVAKLVKKKTKDLKTIASSFQSLQQADADISINLANMRAEIANAKSEAEIAILNANLNLDMKKLEVDKSLIAQRKERAKLYTDTYPRQIANYCTPKVMSSMRAVCGENYAECIQGMDNFFMNLKSPKKLEELSNLLNIQSIYINRDGDVKDATVTTMDANGNTTTTSSALPDGYTEIYCVDAPYFKTSIMEPSRYAMSILYDGMLEYSCTGKNELLIKVLEDLQKQADEENEKSNVSVAGKPNGSETNTAIERVKSSFALAGLSIIAGGNVIGGIPAAIGFISSMFGGSKKVSYDNQRIENGKCVVTQRTKTEKFLGLVKESSSKTIELPALKGHYMGRGKELFDQNVTAVVLGADDILNSTKTDENKEEEGKEK